MTMRDFCIPCASQGNGHQKISQTHCPTTVASLSARLLTTSDRLLNFQTFQPSNLQTSPPSNLFLFIRFRTLCPQWSPLTHLLSITSALFSIQLSSPKTCLTFRP